MLTAAAAAVFPVPLVARLTRGTNSNSYCCSTTSYPSYQLLYARLLVQCQQTQNDARLKLVAHHRDNAVSQMNTVSCMRSIASFTATNVLVQQYALAQSLTPIGTWNASSYTFVYKCQAHSSSKLKPLTKRNVPNTSETWETMGPRLDTAAPLSLRPAKLTASAASSRASARERNKGILIH